MVILETLDELKLKIEQDNNLWRNSLILSYISVLTQQNIFNMTNK